MRAAIANENSDLMAINNKFVMQITGDNDEGKRELDNFINPEEKYPVVATTSKLMTTGVDAQTCKCQGRNKIRLRGGVKVGHYGGTCFIMMGHAPS